jgi:hypothetical protein
MRALCLGERISAAISPQTAANDSQSDERRDFRCGESDKCRADQPGQFRIRGKHITAAAEKSKGRLPILSDKAPITGIQKKFEAPTHSVTARLLLEAKCSTVVPNIGV